MIGHRHSKRRVDFLDALNELPPLGVGGSAGLASGVRELVEV
jgi:hypothetical protein